MITEFMESLENTFGKYKHGMRSAIEDKISGMNESGFSDLLRYLTEETLCEQHR